MSYVAAYDRYDHMRTAGAAAAAWLPAISLGLWHNFGTTGR